MYMTNEEMKKYARLIVRKGVNLQPGQKVEILISIDQLPLAKELMRECYEAGAKYVKIDWRNLETDALTYQYADIETLGEVPAWEEEKMRLQTEELPIKIYMDSEDPDAMADCDPEKMATVRQLRMKVLKKYRDTMDRRYQWVIASIPSPAWAKKIFPDLPEEEAVAQLWEAIKKTVYLDGDPVQNWDQHTAELSQKAAWLNRQKFTKLQYKSANGTDFSVGLIPGAVWGEAVDENIHNRVHFIPNMPTEEIFTSPMAGQADGVLVATKPLSYQSQLIENFSITFKDGKAVNCKAEKGEEALRKMIAMDETSCLLGEVALVPKESPVNQTGLLFFNTLFDENACCHLALGAGFSEVIPGFEGTPEEAQKLGVNDSMIHVDFMVGSDDLEITGIREDGSTEAIFLNGTWAPNVQ